MGEKEGDGKETHVAGVDEFLRTADDGGGIPLPRGDGHGVGRSNAGVSLGDSALWLAMAAG